jgi:Zn-dependent protease/predicted transcriptional regulator
MTLISAVARNPHVCAPSQECIKCLQTLEAEMRSWSIPIGQIFGAEVRVHWTFLALLLFVWLTEYASHAGASLDRGLALVAIIFGCVALHEAGHALVAAHAGLATRSLMLLPIGGITLLDRKSAARSSAANVDVESTAASQQMSDTRPPFNWRRDVHIALAGPVINLLAGFVVGAVVLSVAPETVMSRPLIHSSNLVTSLFWVNILLAGLNALPAYPLDGGRVLRAFLSRNMDPMLATRRAVTVGHSIALLFMFVGMLSNVWITLVGVFLFVAGQIEERSAMFQSVLENVCIEDVMLTDFATLSPADTLEDALQKAVHSLQDDFPVVRGSDMVGVISRTRILHSLRSRGNAYVQSAMTRIFEVVQRQDSLASVFRKISQQGLTILPVVEDQRLVGIVTLQNLMHNMALLAETRKLRKQVLQ